jgi:hypothetical protein
MIPRWIMLVPLVFSFCAMQVEFWGWEAPRTLRPIQDAFGWTVVVFPQTFAILLLPLGTPVAMAILAAINAVVGGVIWRTQPARLTFGRLCTISAVWITLSAGLTFATPYLMPFTWQIGH